MSVKSAFRMTISVTLFLMTLAGSAQSDAGACPSAVLPAYAAAEAACDEIAQGQVCLGSGSAVVTSPAGDATPLSSPGDRHDLDDIERLQTYSMTADAPTWTTVLARLDASDDNGAPATIDMLVIGDVIVVRETSAVPADETAGTALPATIEATAGVIVRQDASAASGNIWQLRNGASVMAIGRSTDGEWIRILIPSPNGGAGWVFARFIAVEGGSESLPYQTNLSPEPSAQVTATDTTPPRLRLESLPVRDDCAEAADSGILLQSSTLASPVELEVNGVTLQLAGAVFITAQVGGDMSVYSLEGATGLTIDDQRTDLPAGNALQIALDASLSPIGMPDAGQPFSASIASELDRLPLQLLPRHASSRQPQARAEEAPICPLSIEQSYDNLERLCDNQSIGSACLGNAGPGLSRIVPGAGISGLSLARPGETSDFTQIKRLSLQVEGGSGAIWPAARLELEADTSGGDSAVATLLLLGEVELTNRRITTLPETAGQSADSSTANGGIEATVQVAGSISVRDQPRVDTDSVALVDDGEVVIARQRSLDQQWIFIETDDGMSGWIVAQFLRLPEGSDALPIFDPAQPAESAPSADDQEALAAQHGLVVDFKSRDRFPGCAEVPPAGLLIQSPGDIDGVLQMTINGALLELTGTAYLTATDDSMTLYSLEGASSFAEPGASTNLFQGEQLTLPLNMGQITDDAVGVSRMYSAEDALRLTSLPIDQLPRDFEIYVRSVEMASVAEGEAGVEQPDADAEAPDQEDGPPAVDTTIGDAQPDDDDAECIINAGGLARNLRQGPGTDFRVIDVLRIGQAVRGQSQMRGTFGFYWYHTDRGWIRFDAGETTAGCVRLPFYVAAAGEFDDDEADAPPLYHETLGDVCAAGGALRSATIQRSGSTYHEFSGLWTGQAGASVTFSATITYFHESFGNVISFVNENGSLWLGSLADTSFTINFAETRNFRVRVSGLLGDRVTLGVSC